MLRKKGLSLGGLIALALVLLLSSCGDKEAATGDKKVGGSIVAGVTNFNGVFHYGWGQSSYDVAVRRFVFGQGLLAFDEGGQVHMGFMTKNREVSEDGLTQVFNLKEGLKFHNGEPFTAEDVVFSFQTRMDTEAMVASGGNASIGEYVESVTALDDYTVEFKLKERIYTTDSSVFGEDSPIWSKATLTKDKPADKTIQQHIKDTHLSNPVGLGPYKFVEYVENQWVKLTINPDFPGNFRGIKPSIENIVLKVVASETDYDELETGNIDLLAGVVEEEKIDAAKAADHLTYSNYPRHGYGHMSFHNDFGPTADVRVRQAIGFMMDRKAFINVFLGSYGSATQGPYSTNYWMIDDEWIADNLTVYEPNLEKAEELLAEAGYTRNAEGWHQKDGEILEIKLASPAQSWTDSLNLVLSENVQKEFGIKFNVQTVDFSVLLAHYYGSGTEGVTKDDRTYHAFTLATSLTPQFDGYANWHSDQVNPWGEAQSQNSARYVNPEADALLMTMRQTTDDEVYKKAYLDWVKIMNRDLPILPLYSNDYHDLYNARIKNFKTSAIWFWQYALCEANL